jgi:hypothetical protein
MFVWFLTAATARSWALAFAVSTGQMLATASAVLTHVNPVVLPRSLPPGNHMNV